MAQRVEVILIDDVSGEAAVETVTFALDGTPYEIDLSADNARKLRSDLERWTRHARRAAGTRRSTARPTRRQDLAQIRDWARKNGYQVSDRGRVSAEIQKAYDAKH